MLRWAREQRGLIPEVAAKRLGISVERLQQLEAGQYDPTVSLLQRMSDKYKRPIIVLLLSEPPTTFTPLNDFRQLPDEEQVPFSPELHDAIRRASEQQEVYRELSAALEQEVRVPKLPAPTSVPSALAMALRVTLQIEADDQATWRDARTALAEWRSRVEGLGILVLEASRIRMGEMRGFSLSEGFPYVVVLNGADSERGKVFTLLHEMSHLALRRSGVCDLHAFGRRHDDIEVFCNEVAGETLIPSDQLLALPVITGHKRGSPWDDEELAEAQRMFGGASTEVLLRRLLSHGLATRPEYEKRRSDLLEAYEEWRRSRSKSKKGGPPPHRMQLRDRGRPFVRTAFDAYSEGAINLADLTSLVGVRTKHLKQMQREAFQ